MHDSPVSKTGFIAAFAISLLFTVATSLSSVDNHSFVVFCNVGQGDASYIHIQPRLDIIIDAGKDSSVLNCLDKYMHPGDGVIELAFISHLQNDHYGGFLKILPRYKIEQLYVSNTKTSSKGIAALYHLLKKGRTVVELLYEGESLTVQNAVLDIFWPTRDYVQASDSKDDSNEGSQVMLFSYNEHRILYTGDISPRSLKMLLYQPIPNVDILKVPHHGSKNGLINEFLVLADPTYGVISVGRKNSYGHPSPETLNMLAENKIEVLRTDLIGDIVFNLD